MRNFSLMAVLVLLSACNIRSQDSENNEVFLSQNQPFKIIEAEKYLQVPDSLRPGRFHEGMLGINYFIDAKDSLLGTNLGLLRMKDDRGNKIIWYRNKSMKPIKENEYPDDVKPYLNWAYQYAKTREIVRIKEVENELNWMLTVVVRLK